MINTKNEILQKIGALDNAPLNYKMLSINNIKKSDSVTLKRSVSTIHQTEKYNLHASPKPISKMIPYADE